MFEDPLLKYYFNRGVFIFGRFVEYEVDAAGSHAEAVHKRSKSKTDGGVKVKAARQSTLARLLGQSKVQAKYRNPTGVAKSEFSA